MLCPSVGAAMCSACLCGTQRPLAHNAFPQRRVPINSTRSKRFGANGFSRSRFRADGALHRDCPSQTLPQCCWLRPLPATTELSLYRSPLIIMAQIILAILLASATAATLGVARRASSCTSQGALCSMLVSVTDDRQGSSGHQQLPQIIRSPCLVMPPNFSLPPLEFCPRHKAGRSRPRPELCPT